MSKLDKLIERLMFLKSLFGAGGTVPTPSGIPGTEVPAAAGMGWMASVPYSNTDVQSINKTRRLHSSTGLAANDVYDKAKSDLITERNAGNTFAVDQLEKLKSAWEEFNSVMEKAGQEVRKAEEEVQRQEAERRKMSSSASSATELSKIRERSAKERLDRAESAQRIRQMENGQTPTYDANKLAAVNRGIAARHPDLAGPIQQFETEMSGLEAWIKDFRARIAQEIAKTRELTEQSKSNVAGHEGIKAGLMVPEQQRLREERAQRAISDAKAAELEGKLDRARRMSGMDPQQIQESEVQRAMQIEQQLQSSAQQKAIMEKLEAVKASEVGEANALASALQRAAAAKAALASVGSGGYGVVGGGVFAGKALGSGAMMGNGGSPTVNNIQMTGVMNNASPQSVFAAMQTAAQIASIRRS